MDYYANMMQELENRSKALRHQPQQVLHSGHTSYDPTMHLAQEFVTVAHHQNKATARLNSHTLTIKLPLNKQQHDEVKRLSGRWY